MCAKLVIVVHRANSYKLLVVQVSEWIRSMRSACSPDSEDTTPKMMRLLRWTCSPSMHVGDTLKKDEEKAKVVVAAWGAELIQFLAALAILP